MKFLRTRKHKNCMCTHEISGNYLIIVVTDWKPVVAYMNNYYRKLMFCTCAKDDACKCIVCTCISFKDSCGEISYSMKWVCANGLHDNYINYLYLEERRAAVENFTFVSNGWLNKFDWILNVSYITSIVPLWNFTRSCLLIVCFFFSVNNNGRRFLHQRTIPNRNKKNSSEILALMRQIYAQMG